MADFKLDRIKFRWAGDWQTTKAYTKDDVVRYQGKAYVALENHTSTNNFYDSRDTTANVIVAVTVGASSIKTGQNVFKFGGVENPVLVMNKGRKYIFDQSDSSNLKFGGAIETDEDTGEDVQVDNPHYLQFSGSNDGLHNGGDVWTDGTIVYKLDNTIVTRAEYKSGFSTATDRSIEVTIPTTGPKKLYYYCETHTGMGNKFDTRYSGMWELMFDGYTWMGDWKISTFYSEGDIVKYKGYIYQCITSHTSVAVAALGLPNSIDNWILYQTTYNWLNTWQPNTYYDLGDVIRENGIVYICNLKHQSAATDTLGLADDGEKWTFITRSDNWRGDWSVSTIYRLDDIVRYGGALYRANVHHTSADTIDLGLEDDTDKWSPVHNGVSYLGDWTTETRYKIYDVVKYGATLWKCTSAHTSGTDLGTDEANWEVYVPGYEYENLWSSDNVYQKGDVVKYGGYTYTALTNNTGSIPSDNILAQDTGDWEVTVTGFKHLGDWTIATDYRPGDVIRANGYLYLALKDSTGIFPDQQLTLKDAISGKTQYASVIQSIADSDAPATDLHSFWASTNPETGFAYADLNRNGQVDEDDVNLAEGDGSTGYNAPLAYIIQLAQDAYRAGTITTYPNDVDNDNSVLQGSAGNEHWQLLVDETYYRAEWEDDQEYFLGDIALYAGTLYRCMERHYSSNSESRPDLDQSQAHNTYWEVFIQGTPTNVLVYRGDIQIYDAPVGKERLAIGKQGQPLKVNTGLPTWENYAVVTNVFYVSTEGTDVPTAGIQESGPFRTIKYATDYITQNLAIKEFNNLNYDLSSGSTDVSMLSAALTNIADNSLDALNLKLFLESTNARTGVAYGDLNASGSITADDSVIARNAANRSPQVTDDQMLAYREIISYINSNPAEFANETVTYNDDGTNIVMPVTISTYPNTTIFVKTGFYEEQTPIKIPRNCVICGDELRSTNIQPAPGYEAENMFYVNNGSGIRNCTLQGLYGVLGAQNQYLTKRPSAGAFVSLDPGTGPDDQTVWITNKSPYIQNVTTFGTGCIGMKVDGALHNGGNDSIVANDFTQIISDGIGYWADNVGRSELVSVFTYYCHIGYLCTNGGILRATNGNNSYGTYGSVAEGFDLNETPIAATINNRNNEAKIDQAFTYGTIKQEIFAVGYSHAGQDYTNANITFGGSGELGKAEFSATEIRDGAVSNVRVKARGDSSIPGGLNYTFIVNNTQGGDTGQIILSAADIGTPELYVGQRITIVSGLGVGQYAQITAFDEVTKIVTVSKESDGSLGWDHFQPGWPIEVLLDETTQYAIEPRVTFEEPTFSASPVTAPSSTSWKHIIWGNNEFVAMSETGAVATSTDGESWSAATGIADTVEIIGLVWNGTKYYAATASKDGLSTDVAYESADGQTWSSVVVSTSAENWKSISTVNGYVTIIAENGNTVWFDGDSSWANTTIGDAGFANGWTIVRSLDNKYWINWHQMKISFDEAAAGTNTGEQHQFWLDVPFNETFAVGDIDNDTDVDADDVSIMHRYLSAGGAAVTTAQAARIDKIIKKAVERQIRTGDLPANWFVTGIFLAVNRNEGHVAWSATGEFWHTLDGTNVTPAVVSPRRAPAFECSDGAYGNNRLVLIGKEVDDSAFGYIPTPYTFDGETWATGYIEFGDITRISYGAGVFIGTGTSTFVAKSQSGATWRTYGDDSANYSTTDLGFWEASAYRAGKWVVVQNGSSTWNKLVTGARPIVRAKVEASRLTGLTIYDPGSNYTTTPTVSIYDNVATISTLLDVKLNDGVLAQPNYLYRGEGYVQFTGTITGSGFAEIYQTGKNLVVQNVSKIPGPGANLEIDGIDEVRYSVSKVVSFTGAPGSYSAVFEITPTLDVEEAPDHNTGIVIRERYSQVRLTGHDFLDIGTGNFGDTRYPVLYLEGVDAVNERQPFNETVANGGGRVFYTSTDQDGNFRVGELFEVEQATGIVTINASQFNLSGLTELSLGGIQVGGSAVVIQEFSKESTFIANSNNVVPTQRAIRSYIESRISGGGSNVQTNALVAGQIRIQTNNIDTTSGFDVIVPPVMNIKGGVDGHYLASMFYAKGT